MRMIEKDQMQEDNIKYWLEVKILKRLHNEINSIQINKEYKENKSKE